MDKSRILFAMNAFMMREFSQRTVIGLKEYKLFKFLLPPFKSFLEINLDKEIDKQREIILCAMEAMKLDRPPADIYTHQLLQKARQIDQIFLHKASSISSAIDIPYHEIDQIRQRRIEHLIEAIYQILVEWKDTVKFRAVIAELYNRDQFQLFLKEILHLYIMETKILSNSVKIPLKLSRFSDSLKETVHTVMKNVADELVPDLTSKVFKNQS